MAGAKLQDVEFVLPRIVSRHRLDLVSIDGTHARHTIRAGYEFRLRSRPWIQRVDIDEQALLLASGTGQCLDIIDDAMARGAAKLRGAIFCDLVDNMNDYPLAFDESGDQVERFERLERISVKLMEKAEQLRKAMR